jgi:hypothetical protein
MFMFVLETQFMRKSAHDAGRPRLGFNQVLITRVRRNILMCFLHVQISPSIDNSRMYF